MLVAVGVPVPHGWIKRKEMSSTHQPAAPVLASAAILKRKRTLDPTSVIRLTFTCLNDG
jgi:hypothetical protein